MKSEKGFSVSFGALFLRDKIGDFFYFFTQKKFLKKSVSCEKKFSLREVLLENGIQR